MRESEFFSCVIGKAALNELHGSLQGRQRGDQQMEMIWHYYEFVKQFSFDRIAQDFVSEMGKP